MNTTGKYKVEIETFNNFADAADYAKAELLGRHYDDHIIIFQWQDDSYSLGYWEPTHRVERDRSGKPVVKR